MAYNFSPFKIKAAEIADWLTREFSSLRTSKASSLILDGVMVESYKAKVSLKHVAAISTEDAKTLRIMPWDKGQIQAIESAIAAANLGLSTVPDGAGLRVIFPDLTEERRKTLIKIIKDKTEDARVSLRQEREKVWNDIQAKERAGELTEDEKFRSKEGLQSLMDQSGATFEAMAKKKEAEILG